MPELEVHKKYESVRIRERPKQKDIGSLWKLNKRRNSTSATSSESDSKVTS